MRVAILSESPADEAALRILVEAMLGVRTLAPEGVSLRIRGWPAVRNILPVIAKELHFKDKADGLVAVVDSNHATVVQEHPRNRLHQMQATVRELRQALRPVGGRVPLKLAVGVASPAIEAWWLCHGRAEISESAWENGLAEKREPYSKLDLKQDLYGVDKPGLGLETERMVEAAKQIAGNLPLLQSRFPNGFGHLAEELRQWRKLS